MAWRAARSLIVLQNQLKATFPNAAPPHTDINSWGLVCDLAHATSSDHCPHDFPGWGNEIVTAGDNPHAPSLGMDAGLITEAMRQARDPRVKYIIFNRRQTGPNHKNADGTWRWDAYTGSDPHDTHFHVSVVGNATADGEQAWYIGDTGGFMTLSAGQEDEIYRAALAVNSAEWDYDWQANNAATGRPINSVRRGKRIEAALTASAAREQAALDAINALATGGTSVDTAAVIAAINAKSAETLAHVQALQDDLDATQAALATASARNERLGDALARAGVAFESADDPTP